LLVHYKQATVMLLSILDIACFRYNYHEENGIYCAQSASEYSIKW